MMSRVGYTQKMMMMTIVTHIILIYGQTEIDARMSLANFVT